MEYRGLGPHPFERPDRVAPLPWARADAFDLQLLDGDSISITCANGQDVWMPIDLKLWCPADAIPKLRERIANWRGIVERPI